jgi:hypothetical protein
VLTSVYLTDIINKIKERGDEGNDSTENAQTIKDILYTIKDFKDRLDDDEKKIEERENENEKQDEI